METKEALKIIREYHRKSNPSEEEGFLYTEALSALIEKTKSPQYMLELGGYYYELRRFDLALKYYELAAEYDNDIAYECLGYIWYYGRTGTKDYEKAFRYYSLAAERGNLVCRYKVADMYKNGYYVEKDYAKYKEIVEDCYQKIQHANNYFDPLPEIYTRLAGIRREEGNREEAVRLYEEARDFLAQRIRFNGFFGNLNIMKWLIEDLYTLKEFPKEEFSLYELYYLLKKPVRVNFYCRGKKQELEAVTEDGACVICFNGKWYRTVDDFISRACIGDERMTALYNELYGFEIVE